jgi:hypothetical protein
MPQYYFHLFDDVNAEDDEGLVLPNDAVAMQKAIKDARGLAAESVRQGHLILDRRIEVEDDSARKIGVVHFRDVVQIES